MIDIVTLNDINKAIIQQLIGNLKATEFKIDIDPKKNEKGELIPDGIIFASTDIVEEITRPSFYINLENNKTNLMLQNARERNLELQLFYFSKNIKNSKMELMDIQDLLSDIFISNLKIDEENYCHINECEFDINKKDGYLILNLELYILEDIQEFMEKDLNQEMLEELETNAKTN